MDDETGAVSAMHETDYVGALHLHCLPFSTEVDDTFFFADPGLTKRLDQLQHLTQFGGMVLIVEGESGSGRTTMLRQLIMHASNSWRVCHLQPADIREPLALIRQLALHFGLNESADPHELQTLLADYWQVIEQVSQVPVVIVDDADQVPAAVLKQLLNLGASAAETVKYLRIVLFGAPGLTGRFAEAAQYEGASSLIHTLVIHPFDEAQTDAYVMYRLAVAGYSGDSPFSPMEIRAIHKSAAGLPARINRLAHQTLMEHVWASPHHGHRARKSRDRRRRGYALGRISREGRWLGAGMAAFVVAGFVWWIGPSYQSPDEPSDANIVSQNLALAHPEASRLDRRVTAEEQRVPQSVADLPLPVMQSVKLEQAPVIEVAAGVARQPPPFPPRSDESPAIPTTPVDLPPFETDNRGAAPMGVREAGSEEKSGAAAQSGLAKSAGVPAVAAQAKEEPLRKVSTGTTASDNDAAGVYREAWLLSQPAKAFTLQLLGVSQKSSVNRFLREYQFSQPVAYFHTYRDSKDWYVLVYGVYADRAAAKAAVASLPEPVRKAGPWSRSFSSIQADIKSGHSP